ncbi:sialidase [Opitutaceae bacterium EW11]|nr:sialidase [Opitutaceae bacterium EW11]
MLSASALTGAEHPAIVRSEFIHEPGAYPACHAATLVETTEGDLLAAWFGGSGESRPDVCIYLSRLEAGRWTPETAVADGVQPDGTRLPSWNPVLFQPRNGPLLLFYKVGPSPAKWWGEMKTSSDGGRSWSAAQRLPEGVLGPIKNKPLELADGTLLCGSSTEDPEPGGKGWQVQIERTPDLGRTWQVVGPLNTRDEFNAIQPSFLTHSDGRIQILCRSMEKRVVASWSSDSGRSWTKLSATPLRSPNSGLDAVTLRDGRQLLVYNWRSSTGAAPAAVGEGDRCPLNVSLSNDGETWHMALTLEDKPLPAGYAYPAVIQTRDGLVHVAYTWNRERIKHVVIDPAQLAR